MATPAQLQAQAAQLEIQIALLTQQIQSANTPAAQQASLIVQRSQLQNDLTIVQQETTALTQQSNPPDPQVPATTGNQEVVQAANANTTANPYAVQAQQNQQVQAAEAEPVATVEVGGTGGTAGTITRVVPAAEAVNAEEANIPTGGNESTVNIGTDENRGGNLEKATLLRAKEQAPIQTQFNQPSNGDWRVRIRLAPNATYLYKDNNPGILEPLRASDGVIFPYTPSINTSYNANYDVTDLVHSNYRGQFYKNSNVGDINITGIFTAQDTAEAQYLLAVIHFFRSVTKMFYGQDSQRGAPPPLVYLYGMGQYQFNNHPCVVKSFTYNLPADVDYIRTQPNNYAQNLLNRRNPINSQRGQAPNTIGSIITRLGTARDLLGNLLRKGALPGTGQTPAGQPGVAQQAVYNTAMATYVPTKIEIQLNLLPIQTRNQVSQQFSLQGYAKGDLLRGGFW